MSKLIYGVATNSKGKYKAKTNGKNVKAYATWKSMLRRVYCPKYHAINPTYIGCSVTAEWLEYQNFANWFENHEYSDYGYQLDKDLLIPDNKIYAPDHCAFVPRQLNTLLTGSGASRGQYPQGVCFDKRRNKFTAHIGIDGKKKHLGCFDNKLDAYLAYKKAKEEHVKDNATRWKNDIAANVYNALMNWELR